jgi:hypothetical protein
MFSFNVGTGYTFRTTRLTAWNEWCCWLCYLDHGFSLRFKEYFLVLQASVTLINLLVSEQESLKFSFCPKKNMDALGFRSVRHYSVIWYFRPSENSFSGTTRAFLVLNFRTMRILLVWAYLKIFKSAWEDVTGVHANAAASVLPTETLISKTKSHLLLMWLRVRYQESAV